MVPVDPDGTTLGRLKRPNGSIEMVNNIFPNGNPLFQAKKLGYTSEDSPDLLTRLSPPPIPGFSTFTKDLENHSLNLSILFMAIVDNHTCTTNDDS